MQHVTRRRFLALLAASAASLRTLRAEAFEEPLGVQLYTLRNVLPGRAEETLKRLAQIGYEEVEILSQGMDRILPILERYDLRAPSGHFPAPMVTGNWQAWPMQPPDSPGEAWKHAVESAAAAGMKFMVIAYLMPSERGGPEFYKRFADQMNAAGAAAKEGGLQLCYHNHAFEFDASDGVAPIEILMDRFDSELVKWELDVFWCSIAGQDPARLIEGLAGDVPLLHLKDVKPETPVFYTESVPRDAFVEVGAGAIEFEKVLKAAGKAGVLHYFVEQDHTEGDPLDSLKTSYNNLRALRL